MTSQIEKLAQLWVQELGFVRCYKMSRQNETASTEWLPGLPTPMLQTNLLAFPVRLCLSMCQNSFVNSAFQPSLFIFCRACNQTEFHGEWDKLKDASSSESALHAFLIVGVRKTQDGSMGGI